MKLKIRDVAFESDPAAGTARIIIGEDNQRITKYANSIEAWNAYTALALRPFEKKLRDELEQNGFNRWFQSRKKLNSILKNMKNT